jgi:hypothetical protein
MDLKWIHYEIIMERLWIYARNPLVVLTSDCVQRTLIPVIARGPILSVYI